MAGSVNWHRIARTAAEGLGREVVLARTNLALSRRAAARLAGVSPSTQQRVEAGDPSVAIDTSCQVASAMGLKVWIRAFPAHTPTLRDTGQLRIAELLRTRAHAGYRVSMELVVDGGRSADAVFFGSDEIIHVEIERVVVDWQAQYRSSAAKRDAIALAHQRPVRLVIVVEDTQRNRTALRQHESIVRSMLPAGPREVMRALTTARPLGRDGLLWIRPRRSGR